MVDDSKVFPLISSTAGLFGAVQPTVWVMFGQNVGFGICAMVGVIMAIALDCPPKWHIGLFRLVGGFLAGWIVTPGIAVLTGLGTDLSVRMTLGLIVGLTSWYVIKAIVEAGKWFHEKQVIQKMIELWVNKKRRELEAQTPAATPPTSPPVPAPITPPSPPSSPPTPSGTP